MGVFSGVGFVLRGWVASANPPAAPRRPRGGDRLRESSQWRKRAFERQKILFSIHSGTGNRQSMRFFTVASGPLWEGGRFLHFPPASGLALGLLLPTHAFWTNRLCFRTWLSPTPRPPHELAGFPMPTRLFLPIFAFFRGVSISQNLLKRSPKQGAQKANRQGQHERPEGADFQRLSPIEPQQGGRSHNDHGCAYRSENECPDQPP